MNPEELSGRLLDFAVRIGKVADALPRTSMARHIAGQLVRSGTSPAPNYEEGCAAESRMAEILEESDQLCKILTSSLLTAKQNRDT